MGRSQSFASAPADSAPCSDSLSLRLRVSTRLTSPARATRRLIMQKARRHPKRGSDRLQAHGFRFFSLRCARFFSPFPHGTVALSVSRSYLALPDGAGCFGRGVSDPALLRMGPRACAAFGYGAVTRCGRPFQAVPLSVTPRKGVLLPRGRLDGRGLGLSAFARHYLRNHCCFLLLRVLRCFSSPGWPPFGCRVFDAAGFPIRTPADHGPCATPRSLSQLSASFLAAGSQGIPHAPLFGFAEREPCGSPRPPCGGRPSRCLFFLFPSVKEPGRGALSRAAPGGFAPCSAGLFLRKARLRGPLRMLARVPLVPCRRGKAARPAAGVVRPIRCRACFRVEVNGVEPMTPCLQSRCSSQLSYTPGDQTGGRQNRARTGWPVRPACSPPCASFGRWACVDSNHGPPHYQCGALTT